MRYGLIYNLMSLGYMYTPPKTIKLITIINISITPVLTVLS